MSTHADATPRSPASTGSAMALSIRQPWAWLIVHGGKDVENRQWATRFRGPVLIHAAKGMTKTEYNDCRDFVVREFPHIWLPPMHDLDLGGIVGEAEIVDCVQDSESRWFFGAYGFVLRNVRPLQFAACRGALGFWKWSPNRAMSGEPCDHSPNAQDHV